jgi:hypothetical protein
MTESEWLTSEDPAAMLRMADGSCVNGIRVSDRKLRLFAAAWRRQAGFPVDAGDYEHANPLGVSSASDWALSLSRLTIVSAATQAALLRDVVGNPFRPVSLPVASRGGLCAACARGRHDHCGAQVSTSGIRCGCQVCWGAARCPWLTPQALTLARAAYEERPGRACRRCNGFGYLRDDWFPGDEGRVTCPDCGGARRAEDGALDPFRLALLADALEEAGCGHAETVEGLERGIDTLNFIMSRCTDDEAYRLYQANLDDHRRRLEVARMPHPLLAHLRSPGPHVRGCWALDLILGKE